MDHAQGFVQIAVFAERETGVARFFGDFQTFVQGASRVEADDFHARAHDVADGAAAQVQGVEDDVVAQTAAAGAALGEHEAQFILGVGGEQRRSRFRCRGGRGAVGRNS